MLLKTRDLKKVISSIEGIQIDNLLRKPIYQISGGLFTLSLIAFIALYIHSLPIDMEIEIEDPLYISKEETPEEKNATLQLQDKNYSDNEELANTNLTTQAEYLVTTVKAGENLSKIFRRLGISQKTLFAIINADEKCKDLANLKPGDKIIYTIDPITKLITYFSYRLKFDKILHLRLDEEYELKYSAEVEYLPITREIKYIEGTIKNSLFKSAKSLGLPKKTITDLTNIFGWDIDFALDIRPEDKFKMLYEVFYHDGKLLKTGDILIAEFTNRNKTFQAIKFKNSKGITKYYTPKGQSMERAFIRTPVKFSRISSHFNLKRRHPKLHRIRAHKGVDYAAHKGTPVTATGDGKVLFIGKKGGYGKVIILKHGNEYTTLYAHLSRFAKKLKKDSKIRQGQVIGYVGKTGLATGNHLHYEFRINGIHHNPLTVHLPKSEKIHQKSKDKFFAHSKKMISMLNNSDLDAK